MRPQALIDPANHVTVTTLVSGACQFPPLREPSWLSLVAPNVSPYLFMSFVIA
jgi:hypothetical protein